MCRQSDNWCRFRGRPYEQYQQVAIERLTPLLLELPAPPTAEDPLSARLKYSAALYGTGLALLPLASEAYLADTAPDELEKLVKHWSQARDQTTVPAVRQALNVLLLGAYGAQGDQPRWQQTRAQLKAPAAEWSNLLEGSQTPAQHQAEMLEMITALRSVWQTPWFHTRP